MPIVQSEIEQRRIGKRTCIVDQHIDIAEGVCHLCKQAINVVHLVERSGNRDRAASIFRNVGYDLVRGFLASTIVDDNIRTCCGLSPGNCGADSLAGASYDYCLVIKV